MPPVNPPKDNPLNMGPSAEIGGTNKPPQSNKRPLSIEKQPVTVWDVYGVPHVVTRQNADDLVRHVGWSRANPNKPVEQPDEDTSPDEKAVIKGEADKTELNVAMDALTALREEATKLGVVVDARWGKKRLNDEIAAAKAGVNTSAE